MHPMEIDSKIQETRNLKFLHEHVSSNMHSAFEQSYEDFGGKMPGLYEGVNLNKKTGHMPF